MSRVYVRRYLIIYLIIYTYIVIRTSCLHRARRLSTFTLLRSSFVNWRLNLNIAHVTQRLVRKIKQPICKKKSESPLSRARTRFCKSVRFLRYQATMHLLPIEYGKILPAFLVRCYKVQGVRKAKKSDKNRDERKILHK